MHKIVFIWKGSIEISSLSEQGFRNLIEIFIVKPLEWEVLNGVSEGRRITGLILDIRSFRIGGKEGCSLFYIWGSKFKTPYIVQQIRELARQRVHRIYLRPFYCSSSQITHLVW
jgi:hypothetical protein